MKKNVSINKFKSPTLLGCLQAEAFLQSVLYKTLYYAIYLTCLLIVYTPVLVTLFSLIYIFLIIYNNNFSIINFITLNKNGFKEYLSYFSVFTATLFFLSNVFGNFARLNKISSEDEEVFRLSAYDVLLSTIFSVFALASLFLASQFQQFLNLNLFVSKYIDLVLKLLCIAAILFLYFGLYRTVQMFWNKIYLKYGSKNLPEFSNHFIATTNRSIILNIYAALAIWSFSITSLFKALAPLLNSNLSLSASLILTYMFYMGIALFFYSSDYKGDKLTLSAAMYFSFLTFLQFTYS